MDDACAPSVPYSGLYSEMVALDLLGPLSVFTVACFDTMLVGKTIAPAHTPEGLSVSAIRSLSQCPESVDILSVPGGTMGPIHAMNDPGILQFLAHRGTRAGCVTSVYTRRLVLRAPRLVEGYQATSHWAVVDLLPQRVRATSTGAS